jgi:hypothetical protein
MEKEPRFYLKDSEDCTEIHDSEQGQVVAYVNSSRIAVAACEAMNRGEDFDFAAALS